MNKITRRYFFLLVWCASIFGCKTIREKASNNQIVVINKGVSGNSTADLLNRLDADVFEQTSDLVIIMVGTNDFLNPKKMVSFQRYESNLNEIVRRIKRNGKQVLLLSPPTVDSVYLFQRHGSNAYRLQPNVLLDSASMIMRRTAIRNGTLFFDMHRVFKELDLPVHNTDAYIRNESNSSAKDGVHPTTLGYKLISEKIFGYLRREGLTNRYFNIICFGDSITYGVGGADGGTSSGKNYPSFLYSMLMDK